MPVDTSTLPSAPARLEQTFPAVPESVGGVRRAVTRLARDLGGDERLLADVALVVSEAATNAVVHGYVDTVPGTLRVVAEPAEDHLHVRVVDDGRGISPRSDSPGLGLGLPTMAQLTTSCDIRVGPDGKGTEVRLAFAAPGMRAPVPEGDDTDARLQVLARVSQLGGLGWPGEGVERLVEVLVPEIADACAVDLLGSDERPRRLAARVAGDRAEELGTALAARRPRADLLRELLPVLRAGEVRVLPVAPRAEDVAGDDDDRATLAAVGVAHWVTVPLRDGVHLLGTLGLGLRAGRPRPEDDIPFFTALGERAARGLANTQLVEEQRRTRRRLERILSALAEAVTVQDAEGRMVYANDAAARLLGAASPKDVLAASPGELAARFIITTEAGEPVAVEDLPGYKLLAGAESAQLLTRSVHRATGIERWLLTKATKLDDEGILVVNIIEDVTEAKESELRQRFLAETGELLASTLDLERTLEHVAELAVPTLADWCAVDVLEDDGALRRVALAHGDPEKVELAERLHREYPPDLAADEGLGAILRGGPGQLHADIPDELLVASARDREHLRLLRALGMRSAMLVPMRAGDQTLGALSLVNAESRRAFAEDDLAFATDVARRAAVAVHNARLFRSRG